MAENIGREGCEWRRKKAGIVAKEAGRRQEGLREGRGKKARRVTKEGGRRQEGLRREEEEGRKG